MCTTNTINHLHTIARDNTITTVIRRSDGEMFTCSLTLNTKNDADEVEHLLKYLEEVRTCNCTKDSVCDKHSFLGEKK